MHLIAVSGKCRSALQLRQQLLVCEVAEDKPELRDPLGLDCQVVDNIIKKRFLRWEQVPPGQGQAV